MKLKNNKKIQFKKISNDESTKNVTFSSECIFGQNMDFWNSVYLQGLLHPKWCLSKCTW